MRILVVQESDWLERHPHQQHHRNEKIIVILEKGINFPVFTIPL